MANFKSLFQKIAPQYTPEELEGLTEPSIMDEYIKQNDPEQYDDIERAKQLKFAMDSAMSGPTGTLKNVARVKDPDLLAEPVRRISKEEIEQAKQYMEQNPPEDAVRRIFETGLRKGTIDEVPEVMRQEHFENLLKGLKNK